MAKIIKRTLVFIIIIFSLNPTIVHSQAAQAVWDLTADNTVATTGNISATDLILSGGLNYIGNNTTWGVQADGFGGGETPCTPTYTAYYEFTITPNTCNDLVITQIAFIYRCSWDPRCYQLFYSINGGPDTQIGADIDIPVRNTDYNYNSGALSISVADGETIRFRLYGSGSTLSDFGCRNLVIDGTTSSISSTASVSIAASPSASVCTGTNVTFTPTPSGGGTAPTYEWFLNGVSQGSSPTYSSSTLNDADQVYCIMTSNSTCVGTPTATSNTITISIIDVPGTPGSITGSTSVQPSVSGLSYIVTAAIGVVTNYVWSLPSPSSWVIDSGQGTTSISATSGLDGENGTISVYAQNSCGNSAPSTLSVAVSTALAHDNCNQCHINHTAADGGLTTISGNANLCTSCHNPSGNASAKPIENYMKATPGVIGTSHNWDIPSVNALYETNLTTDAEMLLRLPGDSIICSTCHNQHQSGIQPSFLRISNAGDALCKNCHVARDKGLFATDPVNNKGTHPVGTVYDTADPRFLLSPTNSVRIVGGNVECSSCHGVHYASSGGANAGSGDGNLLRTTNDENLCTSCHLFKEKRVTLDHENMTCVDCHFAHNSASGNILLINDTINTPNSGPMAVSYIGNNNPNNFAGSGSLNGICEVCHTNTDHYNNTGTGGTSDARHEPASQKCTDCHKHENAFYAQSDCFDCHNAVADKPGVGPAGGRRQIVDNSGDGTGTGGDFKRNSHHVNGSIPNVSDCILCHYMGDHKNGEVKLLDPDQGYLTVYTYNPTNKLSIEDFCLNCHDADGADGDLTPFSDGVAVPLIDATIWGSSSHKNSPYTCLDCHDNSHGSNKRNLLEPYDYTSDGSPDPDNDEEEFCEKCHSAGGDASSDIESEFNRTHTHQVDETPEMGTNSGLECVSCHNPHQNTAANPVSDPTDNNTLMPINNGTNGTRDFCIRCHTTTPPTGISFPSSFYGTGWDKSNYVSSRHDATINIGETNFVGTKDDCLACHNHHGTDGVNETNKTGIYTMINGRFDKSGNATSNACNPWDNNINGDYQLCWDCHKKEMIDKNDGTYGVNAFDDRHDKHVDGEESPCILCHDVHNPYDAGESGHINLTYGASALSSNNVTLFSGLSGSFVLPSANLGECYLRCHASGDWCGPKGHNPKDYDRFPLNYPWNYSWPY